MESPDVFIENVKAIMAARDVTITELAELTGIARPEMSKILNGRVGVTLARGDRIAKSLNVTLSELVKEKKLQHA